jgi:hypothetical protein
MNARPDPLVMFHLKLVAKISLAVGVLAVLVLVTVLTLVAGPAGESYGEIIRAHSMTRQHLGAVMLAAGPVLVALTGVITWLIVCYSSLRVAGPLYRFGQNLKLVRGDAASVPLALRRGDALESQAARIGQAVAAVRAHHARLRSAAAAAAAALERGDAAGYEAALERLKDIDAQAVL